MYESLVGLNVVDERGYENYRTAMLPLLNSVGGDFRYDFRVDTMLKGDSEHDINRVFVIHFPDKTTMEAFFARADYLAIRKQYFDASVKGFTRIAGYDVIQS